MSSPVSEELQSDDIEMLPTVPAESNTGTEESSTVPADATPILTGQRYPQREYRPPLWQLQTRKLEHGFRDCKT